MRASAHSFFWRRFFACALDQLLYLVDLLIILFIFRPEITVPFFFLLFFIWWIFSEALMLSSTGTTLGKMFLGLSFASDTDAQKPVENDPFLLPSSLFSFLGGVQRCGLMVCFLVFKPFEQFSSLLRGEQSAWDKRLRVVVHLSLIDPHKYHLIVTGTIVSWALILRFLLWYLL
ncbi:MAG: RDD family protein [Alphaproteobacteria bacterium]